MKEYDLIVLGAGSGLSVVSRALDNDLRVALVAEKFIGGTCINVGCVPSKTLIYAADRTVEIGEAAKLGISVPAPTPDFGAIMERMRAGIKGSVGQIREWLASTEGLDFYETKARFTGDFTIETADGKTLRGQKIFIATGASPLIPAVEGLAEAGYLTNETVLSLTQRPESMVILGGGYIAVEYGHFFAAMGTKVAIVEMAGRLIAREEPDISELLEKRLRERMSIRLSTTVQRVSANGKGKVLHIRGKDGVEEDLVAETIFVATGRGSNAPTINAQATGVALTGAGFVQVDDYLETTRKNIWAVGDATGMQMFTHAADCEVRVAWQNAQAEGNGGKKTKMDFSLVPHAIFTYPEIAAVGMGEAEARQQHDILVGRAEYTDTVQGDVRMESEMFAKAIVEKKTDRILGFHIIGPQAPDLIQEIVIAMTHGIPARAVAETTHIFPAMCEVVQEALNKLE